MGSKPLKSSSQTPINTPNEQTPQMCCYKNGNIVQEERLGTSLNVAEFSGAFCAPTNYSNYETDMVTPTDFNYNPNLKQEQRIPERTRPMDNSAYRMPSINDNVENNKLHRAQLLNRNYKVISTSNDSGIIQNDAFRTQHFGENQNQCNMMHMNQNISNQTRTCNMQRPQSILKKGTTTPTPCRPMQNNANRVNITSQNCEMERRPMQMHNNRTPARPPMPIKVRPKQNCGNCQQIPPRCAENHCQIQPRFSENRCETSPRCEENHCQIQPRFSENRCETSPRCAEKHCKVQPRRPEKRRLEKCYNLLNAQAAEMKKELDDVRVKLFEKELENQNILQEVRHLKNFLGESTLLKAEREDAGSSKNQWRSKLAVEHNESTDEDDDTSDNDDEYDDDEDSNSENEQHDRIWYSKLRRTLSQYGNELVVRPFDKLPKLTKSVEAVLLIKNISKNSNGKGSSAAAIDRDEYSPRKELQIYTRADDMDDIPKMLNYYLK